MSRDKQKTPVENWINSLPPKNSSNGLRKLVWWLLTTFAGVTAAVIGIVYSSLRTEVDHLRTADGTRGERVSVLEARSEETHRRFTVIESRLVTIDGKLDETLRELRWNRSRERRHP